MLIEVACPRCGELVDLQARSCQNCGIDLALAVLLAEQALNLPGDGPGGIPGGIPGEVPGGLPMAPEILVPRLGDYLIERGVLTSEQLSQALDYQRNKASAGQTILMGQALLELNLVDREILDQVITEQILQLQAALRQSNQQLEQRVQERTIELQNALTKLAELNQLKSNFISNISHELRTPLTHIKGYLDLLADGSLGPITADQLSALEVLQRSEVRLEHLIDDLIRFSLAVRGEFSLKLERVDLEKLILQAIEPARKAATKKQLHFEVTLSPDLASVWIDKEKIEWVIGQLVDNAIKFTPSQGQISLTASCEERLILVRICDNGIGIPEERIPEIFEPFHQLDGSNTRHYGGTGLGLALARRIIEAHGSEIKVNSEVGKGTQMEFSLLAMINSHV